MIHQFKTIAREEGYSDGHDTLDILMGGLVNG